MTKKIISIIIALFLITFNSTPSFAQEGSENPSYIVEPGENLTEIAVKFGVSVQDIISINAIVDSNLISAGTELIIPGLEGVSGLLITYPVQIGESYQYLLRKNQLSSDNFKKINKVTSPSELFIGTNLILPSSNQNEKPLTTSFFISRMTSVFEQSVLQGQNHWFLNKSNGTDLPFDLPGDSFFFPLEGQAAPSSPVSPFIQSIELSPLPIAQGHTAELKITSDIPVVLNGELDGRKLNFFYDQPGQFYYSLDGIHALAEPGLVELRINGSFENGEEFSVDQMALLASGGYIQESITVESTYIDEALNIEEAKKIDSILTPVSNEKLWTGPFRFPVVGSLVDPNQPIAFSSGFGNRRSYNDGQYFGFHGGLDFTVVLNSLDIFAPAPGIVLFAGPMDIRGNTTFIDHGQGVVSGYAHQSEILVQLGERVETGQVIGKIGKTGRVTGPHLHWDIWVNGNQINPFDWINTTYP